MNKKAKFYVLLMYIIAAAAAFLICRQVFIIKQIAPYGNNSVLCMDLWGQYFPMYIQNARAESLSELFYSWDGAFGHNNWAQSAYYCNSVFLLLLKFIPLEKTVEAIDIFCMIKIVLSALSCLAFLRHKLKNNSPVLVGCAVAYSVCAYMQAFLSQFMWTDLLIYAPLILIGIDRLVYESKSVMYTLMLAAALISNFYVGFAMCIFSVVYFTANALMLGDYQFDDRLFPAFSGFDKIKAAFIRFAVFSLLAGMLSAVYLIPVGMAISGTLAADADRPEKFEWYGNIISVFRDMLTERPLYLEYDNANIATSVAAFIALPVYFCNNKIKVSERIFNFLVLIFLLISLNCNILNYIWHGFHFPNQLPGRWTFLFALFIVMLTAAGLSKLDGLLPFLSMIGCIIGLTALPITGNGLEEKVEITGKMYFVALMCAAAVMVVSVICVFTRGTKRQKKDENRKKMIIRRCTEFVCSLIMAAVIIFDCGSNFMTVSQYEGNKGLQVSDEEGYAKTLEKMCRNGEKQRSGKTEFYRTEANGGFTFNSSMLGGYHGMGYYSSTMQGNVFEFLKYLGNRVYADKVSTVYTISSPVQNTLFGIKYFMDFNRDLPKKLPYTVSVSSDEDCDILENQQALSLAYAVSDGIADYAVGEEIRAVQNQNKLLDTMLGEETDIFEKTETEYFNYTNAVLLESENWNTNYFQCSDTNVPVTFNYVYAADKDGDYFIEHNYRAGKLHIISPFDEKTLYAGDGSFIYAGKLKKGEKVNVDVTIENISLGCCGLNLYYFNKTNYDEAYEKLAAHQLNITKFNNTFIEGAVSMDKEGLLFSSIPWDGGWSVYCDGKKIKAEKLCGTFVGARIPEGEHKIVFKYSVPGIKVGLALSIIGLAVIFIYVFRTKKHRLAHL